MAQTHLSSVALVVLGVTDQARALAFYTDALGFEKVADFPYADATRWLEVAPPGSPTRISLAKTATAGTETGIVLTSSDLATDHADLVAADVAADPIITTTSPPTRWAGTVLAGIPSMFLLRDPDGNSLLVVEQVQPGG